MASRKIGTCIRSSSTLLKHFVSSMASDAASSSDRPAKLRKIVDFRRQLPYVHFQHCKVYSTLSKRKVCHSCTPESMPSRQWSRNSDLSTSMAHCWMKWSARC